MSIDDSGLNGKILGRDIVITVKGNHPLIQLGQALSWDDLAEIILPDLKSTTKKGRWWMGRPLHLRIHLGAYILQQIFNKTDRQTEYDIKDNAVYQLFCGRYLVKKWHYPDHTKIEEFRSRLSPETQKQLANTIAGLAVKLGFADPAHIDIDSTIQETNMTYPSDSGLLCKLGNIAKRVADYLNEKLFEFKIKPMEVNLKGIKSMARRYFFLKKTATQEERNNRLNMLLDYVFKEVRLVISNSRCMGENFIKKMPWNIRNIFCQFIEKADKYLKDVKYFLQTNQMVPNKILSFHLNEVCCFTKNKPGKKYQFGRVFQLARIKGNFLFSGKCEAPNLSDKKSVQLMLDTHQGIFNDIPIKSASTDKGYYSTKNEKLMAQYGVTEIGIQRPGNVKKPRVKPLPLYREEELVDRRAGIEPLIGHAKHKGQLGKSRMKSDKTIEASGFTAILGFNLRQLIRYKIGKIRLEAT
jgi:hypothetical protein